VRKVILFNMITLDGFFAGPDGDIDWHQLQEGFNDFSIEQINAADGILFGRVTYQMMASYWPTPEALTTDPEIAELMNTVPKYVFSNTLDAAEWSNTTLIKGDAVDPVRNLKQQAGKDLLLFGSADLAADLTAHGLIDEYRLIIVPVVLGKGLPLFKDVKQQLNLKLLKSQTFENGNVMLYYEPVRG
jgi:dihydrofolate reductase